MLEKMEGRTDSTGHHVQSQESPSETSSCWKHTLSLAYSSAIHLDSEPQGSSCPHLPSTGIASAYRHALHSGFSRQGFLALLVVIPVDQATLKFKDPPAYVSQVLAIKPCTTASREPNSGLHYMRQELYQAQKMLSPLKAAW